MVCTLNIARSKAFDKRLPQFVLVLFTLICVSLTTPTLVPSPAYAGPAKSFEQRLDQVRLYLRNKMYKAALTELNQLSQTRAGQQDVRVFTALAQVNYRLYEITAALGHLRTARRLSTIPEEQAKLTALYEQWLSTYGLVRFEAASEVSSGKIKLLRKRKLINQERQAALTHVIKQLEAGVTLPLSLYLPYGSYEANQTSFKISRDQATPVVEVLLQSIKKPKVESESSIPWLYVGIGSAALIAAGVGGYFLFSEPNSPEPAIQVTISSSGR